jgi:hypothetical protein
LVNFYLILKTEYYGEPIYTVFGEIKWFLSAFAVYTGQLMIGLKYLEAVTSTESLWEESVERTSKHRRRFNILFWGVMTINFSMVVSGLVPHWYMRFVPFLSLFFALSCIGYSLCKITGQKDKAGMDLSID